jgi:hypothetical protein
MKVKYGVQVYSISELRHFNFSLGNGKMVLLGPGGIDSKGSKRINRGTSHGHESNWVGDKKALGVVKDG